MNQYFETETIKEMCITTKNGIPIYYYKNNHLHSFCICLYIKAGCLYESDDTNGITHLWEHIIFKNLNHIYNGEFYKILDKFGLNFSAQTYKEFVLIKVKGAVKHVQKACKLISLVFEPICISSKELETEKKRVKSEIREFDEKSTLDYFTDQMIWKDTSLQNMITGKIKIINKLRLKSLQEFQQKILSFDNLFFYVTGCFENEDLDYLSMLLSEYTIKKSNIEHNNIAPIPDCFFHRNSMISVKNSTYHYLRFSFDLDLSRYTFAEIDLIYDVLFSNETSKFFQELSEKSGYIYSYDAKIERYNNIGNLYMSFEVEKKNIISSITMVINILKDIKTNLIDELDLVLPTYLDNADFMLDEDENLNFTMAYENHIMNQKYQSIDERKKAYQSVTAHRLLTIANEIFVSDNLVLTLKTNKKNFVVDEVVGILIVFDDKRAVE